MRLIDADFLKEWVGEYLSVFKKYDKSEVKGFADHAPTIEPKRGEWVLSSDGNGYIGNPVYKCTVCGWWDEQAPYNFCPNCGADMRKESE